MPRFRPTARLLVLDPADRVLLFSAVDSRGQVWFTPGGGVHPGRAWKRPRSGNWPRRPATSGPKPASGRWWTTAGLRATGDRIVPYGLSGLVDRLVSDGVPTTPVRLPWRLGT